MGGRFTGSKGVVALRAPDSTVEQRDLHERSTSAHSPSQEDAGGESRDL